MVDWDSFVQVSGSDFSTGNTSATNITGLSIALLANSIYEVQCALIGQSSTAAGVTLAISFSAAGATGAHNSFVALSTTSGSSLTNVIGTLFATSIWTTATTDQNIIMRAIVKTGANAGNVTAQVAKTTSGTVTIYIGSVMKVRKLP